MALKVLMCKKKLDQKRSELDALRAACDFEKREEELEQSIEEAETEEEQRTVEEEIEALEAEKADKEAQIAKLEEEIAELEAQLDELEKDQEAPAEEQKSEERSVMSKEFGRASMEYRTAFRDWVLGGKADREILETRGDAAGTASDLGILLPETIVQEIQTAVGKVYGQLYGAVKKTNLKGGVKYPIGSFSATFHRITETGKSDRQDPGGVTGYVTFGYNIGEVRIARTLLQATLSVPVFEQELAKVIAEAYVKAIDKEIMVGDATNNECVGILTEAAATASRIPAANTITFSDADAADWTAWQKKLFAKIPLAMRGESPEFVMTAATYESVIKTMKDNNNRPLFAETFNPVDGTETATFKGKKVTFVENDILKDFDLAEDGEYFGMYWVPQKAYAINSNLEFTVVDYFDHETNQYVKKALVINDGQVLDGQYIYLLRKGQGGDVEDIIVTPKAQDQKIYNVNVSDIQGADVAVLGNRAITGTSKWLSAANEITNVWGAGNFLAVDLTGEDWSKFTSVKVGLEPSAGSGLVDITGNDDAVFKINDKDAQKLVIVASDGKTTEKQVLSLSGVKLMSAGA